VTKRGSAARAARTRPLAARLQRVKLLAMDVDGVLTDGTIFLSASGEEFKGFFSRDGLGLKGLHLAGLHSAFVTARGSPTVARRAAELGVRDVVLNSANKGQALRQLSARRGLELAECAFIGDDLQDLPAMVLAGVAFAVNGAPEEVRARADVTTRARGGEGAVREVIDRLLKAQGKFAAVLRHFLEQTNGTVAASAPPADAN
jgi:3-deoxy-D-manno-octulosonate 8-phosphate phosphatase (KDO 8-P phosphatase)